MGRVKSAFEKAMEKVEKLGKASPEELKRMEYVPRGNAIAARYLRGELADLAAELAQHETDVRKYLVEGALEALVGNICLPLHTHTRQTSAKAMEGVLTLKENSKPVREILDQIEHLFTYYEGAVQQSYTRVKQEFEARLSETRKALGQQLGTNVRIDVERQPQFQEEWRKARAGLDVQYEKVLQEHKQRLLVTT